MGDVLTELGIAPDELEKLGLETLATRGRVAGHLKRLKSALRAGPEGQGTFRILEACRRDNGRIFLAEELLKATEGLGESSGGCASFIPAAGAASRYLGVLEPLRRALEAGDLGKVRLHWGELTRYRSVLPPALVERTDAVLAEGHGMDDPELRECFVKPKALMPSGLGGRSFLRHKFLEDTGPFSMKKQIFIIPPGQRENFLEEIGRDDPEKVLFVEQDGRFSTLRVSCDGEPVRDQNGRLSVVPAGHGALVGLLPEIKERLPDTETLFIRNIDNVYPESHTGSMVSGRFLKVHKRLLALVRGIRDGLNRGGSGLRDAQKAVETFLQTAKLREPEAPEKHFLAGTGPGEEPFWRLLFLLFQTPVPRLIQGEERPGLLRLTELFNRPVNVLGQVRNRGTDKGGSPVIVETEVGPVCVCLERPHASKADQKNILDNPDIATHFNPVFVAAEPGTLISEREEENPFWIMARKTWQGKPVVYFETVLYEILGNSLLANCVYVEIPGSVFCPRKTLADTLRASVEPP